MIRRFGAAAPTLCFMMCAACIGHSHYSSDPSPISDWPTTRLAAQTDASNGDYHAADSVLAAFQMRYPYTADGTESLYWRALFKLDPSNVGTSTRDAIALFDQYLESPHHEPHTAEVLVLRRTARLVNTIQRLADQAESKADSARTQADSVKLAARAGVTRARTKDEEIARLRDALDKALAELDQANQELDRIKKRLAAPKP
ncbi:MAG TPA: hypothetical protein VNW46_07950 [Gemmatimonadaceae bacterium]|nr:hypothetical protein [Gemmatimonadaceae bacterium]